VKTSRRRMLHALVAERSARHPSCARWRRPRRSPARPRAEVGSLASRRGPRPARWDAAGPGPPDPGALSAALGAAVARAAGEGSPVAGFRKLFRASDVVGIKLNCIAGKGLSPRPEVVALLTAGSRRRGCRRATSCCGTHGSGAGGRRVPVRRGRDGVRVYGTNQDYDSKPTEWGPNASLFPRLLREDVSALINVGVLKDHDLAGVSLGMKNWYGAIHNPNKCHADGCSPYVAHLAAFPLIREKLRLTVIDGITGPMSRRTRPEPRVVLAVPGVSRLHRSGRTGRGGDEGDRRPARRGWA